MSLNRPQIIYHLLLCLRKMMTFKTNVNIKTFYCISQLTAQGRIFLPGREHAACGIAQIQLHFA